MILDLHKSFEGQIVESYCAMADKNFYTYPARLYVIDKK